MRLSDFINKERENLEMQNVDKSDLVKLLVEGLHSEIIKAAKRTYKTVCAEIAKQVAGGSQYVTGFVYPNARIDPSSLPEEFEKYGTPEMRAEIKKENHIGWSFSDGDGNYVIPFTASVPTRTKIYYQGNMRCTEEKAVKLSKMCMWNVYENEVRRLLAQDGIKCEFKVAVTTWKDTDALKWAGIDKKRKVTKKYINIEEEYSHSWFGNKESLELQLHYSYSHK